MKKKIKSYYERKHKILTKFFFKKIIFGATIDS